jgi:transposase
MMLPRKPKRVFLAVGHTDMRKSINGLSVLVERAMDLDPFAGDLFVFCNRRRNMVKILYWDKNGFALWHKRLEKHRFHWPTTTDGVVSLSTKELEWLLVGLDFTRAHAQLNYRFAS